MNGVGFLLLYVLACLLVGGLIAAVVSRREDQAHDAAWPDASELVADEQGVIHHPTLGDYPAVVPYTPGMTLYPGQEVHVAIIRQPPPEPHEYH